MGRPSKYTPELREEAVRLHREQGASVAESARRLGLGSETLLKWVRQAEVDAGERAGATREEHAENVRLKRELRRAEEEKLIAVPAPDLVERNFSADAPDRVWVADITYIRCYEGWLYLAIVIDLFSRKIVGWSMRASLEAEIVSDALAMAVARRRPAAGIVHHSDRGSQYTSLLTGKTLRELGVTPSMGSKGCAYDNAAHRGAEELTTLADPSPRSPQASAWPEAAHAVVLRLLVAQRLVDTASLPNADRQGIYEPRELAGSAVLAKLARRVAPSSVKQHLAGQEAEQERREQAWRDEQAARFQEQRDRLAAGEPVRCGCCLGPIETTADAAEKHGTLVHAGDCEQQWGSRHDDGGRE
jgi:transposase-like protein